MPITQPHTPSNTKPRADEDRYEKIAEFAVQNSGGFYGRVHIPIIKATCKNFDKVGRLITVSRGGDITAVCYFDLETWNTAFVHDIIIKKENRGRKMLKSIIVRALMTYPQIRKVRFESRKHGGIRTYDIKDFFKGDLNGKH